MTGGTAPGPDGRLRCPWSLSTAAYLAYHDTEWGRPIRDDNGIFERLTLEGFQSGLSWLTILRKRENFRAAFAAFDIETVAAFGPSDRARLMADAGIVRNAAKIEAAIMNAMVAAQIDGGLASLVWGYAPDPKPAPDSLDDVPSQTAESVALAKALKSQGFRFVGPTTAYALMQAAGLVNDHLRDCFARSQLERMGD